ncbi:hypothetical protein ACWHAM_01635 [Paenibacillus terrae]
MGFFLDIRSSTNSSQTGEGPNIQLGPEPERFGLITLRTFLVPGPIVTFSGSIGLVGELGDTYAVEIVRGTNYDPSEVVYRAEGVLGATGANETQAFNAQDLSAPWAIQTVYSSYISGVSTTVRNGPEVFTGIASTPFF